MNKKLTEKVQSITSTKTPVRSSFFVRENSVHAELRLEAEWEIHFPIDWIQYPKNLARDNNPIWAEMSGLVSELYRVGVIDRGRDSLALPINIKTKTGPARRAEERAAFEDRAAREFLAAYRKATSKRSLADLRKKITDLQSRQKAILPQMRKVNSEFLASRKAAKAERDRKNTEALASGLFWEADKEALKDYFHPPFDRNYLADVSERWRAALYTEMKSTAWKAGKRDWRYKNVGTGHGYLCGIDDNGDEWGHEVDLSGELDIDYYGDKGYMASVEDAMSVLFDIPSGKLDKCQRQGDLLFCMTRIPGERTVCANCHFGHADHYEEDWWTEDGGYQGKRLRCVRLLYHSEWSPKTIPAVTLEPEEKWEIIESHEAWSPDLRHNGQYFASGLEIMITHTSHETVVLPPGEYRIYTLDIPEAD